MTSSFAGIIDCVLEVMRNPTFQGDTLNHGNTPTQHNSTLAVSPVLPTGRLDNHPHGPHHLSLGTWTERSQIRNSHSVIPPNIGNSPYQALATSPLIQKSKNSIPNSLATPYHRNAVPPSAPLLASMSKESVFGSTLPSTLRKVSLQRENKDSIATFDIEEPSSLIAGRSTKFPGTDEKHTAPTNISGDASLEGELNIDDLTYIERLRLWRHDALMQHMYTTAEFVGNKIYSITNDPNDAFWLAQSMYGQNEHIRAINLISTNQLETVSIMCRYLMAKCLVETQKYDEALDIVGEENPFAELASKEYGSTSSDGGVKLESSLCFLRGQIYCALNNFSSAKEAYKEAVLVDVKNFEAFNELTKKNLMTPEEMWDLLPLLDFDSLGDNRELIRSLYMINIPIVLKKQETDKAIVELQDVYQLGDNVDILRHKVELLYHQCRFDECVSLCENILSKDEFCLEVLPIYIGCLHESSGKNKLFLLSHRLAESLPKKAITWYSVGTYYLTIGKINEARKYLSKASILDPTFTQAWLAFADTYAIEGEQDQALAAYSTAARFFPGTHLPNLYLGMQHMASNTLTLAEEYFSLAYEMCPNDPLVLNEMGVMYFKASEFQKSKNYLKRALLAAKRLQSTSKLALAIQLNLAHTYRKLGDDERAIGCMKSVLINSEKRSEDYCVLAFLYLRTKKLQKAINALHISLSLKPSNSSAHKLLNHALKLNVSSALDLMHPLVVNSGISEKNMNQAPGGKRRLAVPSQSINDSKRSKTTENRSFDGDKMDDHMDIED